MKKLKKRLSILLCITLIMAMSVPVSAAYLKKVDKCPRCRTYNTSFGYEANSRWKSETVKAGEYCKGCGEIVGQRINIHFFAMVKDVVI